MRIATIPSATSFNAGQLDETRAEAIEFLQKFKARLLEHWDGTKDTLFVPVPSHPSYSGIYFPSQEAMAALETSLAQAGWNCRWVAENRGRRGFPARDAELQIEPADLSPGTSRIHKILGVEIPNPAALHQQLEKQFKGSIEQIASNIGEQLAEAQGEQVTFIKPEPLHPFVRESLLETLHQQGWQTEDYANQNMLHIMPAEKPTFTID